MTTDILEIFTFGTIMLRRGGVPITGLASRKAEALMIYLACTDQVHTREALATLFWDDRTTAQALANLRVVVSSLRQQLAPWLKITSQTIAFNPHHPYWLDVAELRTAFDTTAFALPKQLEKGVALYRGDFMQSFHLRDSSGFETWMFGEQDRLKALTCDAIRALIDDSLARGAYQTGIQFATRLLAIDPLQESVQSQMMDMLSRTGQVNAALIQYETYRRLLANELGVEPEAGITLQYQQLCNRPAESQPNPSPKATFQLAPLPRPLTSFVGRAIVANQIAARLADPNCRLLTLLGPGGIGKTRLALQVAEGIQNQFDDGVCLVELASLSQAELVPSAIAKALKLKDKVEQPAVESVGQALQVRSLLLVLDNFEHLLEAASFVTEWLSAAPNVKVLVTSREPLHVYGEHELHIPPLPLPEPGQLRRLDAQSAASYAAIQLFVDRARAVRPDFNLTPATAPLAAEICIRLDGIPLAIELAAARCRDLESPAQILAQLSSRLTTLNSGPRDRPARQRTLRGALDWSYNLLTEVEQKTFASLGVFLGGWTPEAAEAVMGETLQRNGRRTLDLLGSLVDKNLLLRMDGQPAAPRFTMLETMREYALEQLQAADQLEAVQDRHLTYYLALAEQAEVEGAAQANWLERLECEHDNFRAALHYASQCKEPHQNPETFLRLCAALGLFWRLHNHLSEGRSWLGGALSLKDPGSQSMVWQAKIANHCGWVAARQGDYPPARTSFEQSLTLWQTLDDLNGIAEALHGLGHVAMLQRQYDQAANFYQDSLARLRAQGKTAEGGVARVLYYLGSLAVLQGAHGQAFTFLEESLTLANKQRNERGIALAFKAMAQLALTQGESARAIPFYTDSLKLFYKLGDRYNVSHGLMGLAFVAASLDQPVRAVQLLGADEALRDSLGVPVSPAIRPYYDHYLAACTTKLDSATLTNYWAKGRSLTFEEAVTFALSSD